MREDGYRAEGWRKMHVEHQGDALIPKGVWCIKTKLAVNWHFDWMSHLEPRVSRSKLVGRGRVWWGSCEQKAVMLVDCVVAFVLNKQYALLVKN